MPETYPPNYPDYLDWLDTVSKQSKSQSDQLRKQPVFGPWITPTLLNSFAPPTAPKIRPQYRLHIKEDKLQTRGHVDATGATSNTVVYVLLEPFWRDYDISFLTDIESSGNFQVARCFIDSTNGEVSLIWPAT